MNTSKKAKENYFIPTEEEFLQSARDGDKEIIEAYIRHEADVNIIDKHGRSALMYASKYGHTEIVQLLLNAGADVNIIDEHGQSAFMLASSNGHTEIIQLLLEHEADVNIIDKYGWSALMLASRYGRTEIVQLLLDHGADVNSVNKDGRSALMYASKYGHTEIVQLLLEHEAEVNIIDNDGWSTLMFASRYGHIKIVQLILDQEAADVNSVNKDGWSTLMFASRYGHTEIENLLRHYKGHKTMEMDKMDLTGYNTEPIDYTGCDPIIAEALKQGLSIECEYCNNNAQWKGPVKINAYDRTHEVYPYRTKDNGYKYARPIKKLDEYEQFRQDCIAGRVAVDTPIIVYDNVPVGFIGFKRYFAKYEDGLVYAWRAGSTSWSTDEDTTYWEKVRYPREGE